MRQTTRHLIAAASRVTPRAERSRWVVTVDDREWHQDGARWFAYDGTRDASGVSVRVADLSDEDLREFAQEQLDHYGVTNAQINGMFS